MNWAPEYCEARDGCIYEKKYPMDGWRFYCTKAAWPYSPAAKAGVSYTPLNDRGAHDERHANEQD